MIDRSLRLTRTQRQYLTDMAFRGRLVCGWGGMSSTRTVRVLEERGLCALHVYGPGKWTATITKRGRLAIAAEES